MTGIFLEFGLLFVLLVANGVFAMAEIAVVSSRRARLQMLADKGTRGARTALRLVENPGVFLSTVQVGITLVGTLAGASSGAAMIGDLTPVLAGVAFLQPWAATLATIIVVGGITFLSVVIGELVPKRLAIVSPEIAASRLSRPMAALSRLAGPVVNLLDVVSGLIARMLGAKPGGEPGVSEDEVRALIHQGTLSGVFKPSEQRMVEGVLELDDLVAADVMTPKNSIVWIDLDASDEENGQKIAASGHSHFPAHRGMRDNVLGMISVKALWARRQQGELPKLESMLTEPVFVPETMSCPRVIEEFRKQRRHLALVVDEFGGVAGLVTLNDMMEAVLGSMPDQDQRERPQVREQSEGVWIVDAQMDIEDVADATGLVLPREEIRDGLYRTLSGFILHRLGHVPKEGERFASGAHQLEITDTDRQRIDKVTIRRMGGASIT
ncbi:hemolysin family protein [Prosthecobacter sp.]|uniref:hemolysin family protein n=1 Tax=Prosthecobacter sp. TaxID=1965333 RepID=UPI001D438883|nr:hemolysin family protein [Prosthecobacter sp.]MCB1277409.1 HlyC/CorC family transporter [Prosthecobacter sp.]